ncbi:hypothetical protein CJF42_10205 [Pseudoalteromonas sp. NBT06-2]|uniref:lipopolysaccharide biosynthesis protein n=1 Tax=Pseudoalteromonas sp. NBT06-2 TaxID=2025950 RepID=UPI000BA5695E|nr:oligosaccharide flippase family protein [Pseudoalteromonas sp. NBT06-2]PAJ74476.1 hypothetical protein CJF42_10205 [Pseudoalteromonas sp. NBT06-2]
MINSYYKKVATLVSGTVLAQIIALGLYPILSRIFTAEEFAAYGVFTAIVTPMAILITLRYEAAIVLPKKDLDSLHIWWVSILLALAFSASIFLLTLIFSNQLLELFSNKISLSTLLLIPLGALSIAVYQALTYLGLSRSSYRSISISKVVQSLVLGVSQVGLFFIITNSLIIGFIIGQLFAAIYLFCNFKPGMNVINKSSLKRNALTFSDYPKFNALPSFLDTFTLQLPLIIVATGSDFAVAGYLTLVFRILAAPAAVIGGAVGQVFLKEISDTINEGSRKLMPILNRTLLKLSILSLCAFLPVYFFGDYLFAFVFGDKWSVAGEYAQIICIAIGARFIVSPLSTLLGVSNHLKLAALWKVAYFVSTFIMLSFAITQETDSFLLYFVLNELIMYSIYLSAIFYAAKNVKNRN